MLGTLTRDRHRATSITIGAHSMRPSATTKSRMGQSGPVGSTGVAGRRGVIFNYAPSSK